ELPRKFHGAALGESRPAGAEFPDGGGQATRLFCAVLHPQGGRGRPFRQSQRRQQLARTFQQPRVVDGISCASNHHASFRGSTVVAAARAAPALSSSVRLSASSAAASSSYVW